jgi:CO/xanthine dehydrogenase Mo-binding subunit
MTVASLAGVAGQGLVGVAKDTLPQKGSVPGLAVGFMKIALDVETGAVDVLEYVGVADCGVTVQPRGLAVQTASGAIQGIGMAKFEHLVYDPKLGLPANVGFDQAKPATWLDIPLDIKTAAVDKPDPNNPMGAKGIGEPVEGCAAAAYLSAVADALGGHYFNRTPIVRDYIVNVLAKRPQSYKPLEVSTM